MAHFEQNEGASDEWYTPPYVFNAMQVSFDLDVASPGRSVAPWIPAAVCYTQDSLVLPWFGFVWCNPPFGGRNGIVPWCDKFFEHGNGVLLTPDRTSAPWWQDAVRKADTVLFVSPKIRFLDREGKEGVAPSTGTTLMAVGVRGVDALQRAESNGLGLMFNRSTR